LVVYKFKTHSHKNKINKSRSSEMKDSKSYKIPTYQIGSQVQNLKRTVL
jgi:hypothetical protein